MSEASTVSRRPGRPRDPQADALILEAALEELALNGFGGFTVDAVAARAGVGKATIYRRWPSREDLVLGAASIVIERQELPDTGSLRDDLVRYFAKAYRDKATPRADRLQGVFAAVVAEAAVNVELRRLLQGFLEERRSATREMVGRGIERGEISADVDRDLLIDMISGPLFYRSTLSGRVVDDDVIGSVVDCVLRGLGAAPSA